LLVDELLSPVKDGEEKVSTLATQCNESYKAESDDCKSIGYLPRLGAPGSRRSLNRLMDLQPRGEPVTFYFE
jgi:hypothetical protein